MQRLSSPRLALSTFLGNPQRQHQVRNVIFRSPKKIEERRAAKARVLRESAQSPRKEVFFQLPNLVVDLDAENEERVRIYDEVWEKKEQAEIWSRNSAVDALSIRMGDFAFEVEQSEKLWKADPGPFAARRITDRDLLFVALLGASAEAPATSPTEEAAGDYQAARVSDSSMAELLQSNGIARRILSQDTNAILFMMHWQAQHPTQEVGDQDLERLESEMPHLEFQSLRRIVGQLLQSDTGCSLLGRCANTIVSVLEKSISGKAEEAGPQDETGPGEVLTLLNNITINLQSRGIDVPKEVRELGATLAMKLSHEARVDLL